MVNKNKLVNDLDEFINTSSYKLTEEEIACLSDIRSGIAKSNEQEEILKWLLELCKYFTVFKDIFGS